MNRAEKEEQVKFLTDAFSRGELAVVAGFRGVTVEKITQFRKEMRGAGAAVHVVKNNLTRIAIKNALKDAPQADSDKLLAALDGPTFLAFSFAEPVAPAKVISKFCKSNDTVQVKGAWFEGHFIEKSSVEELSKMPSREEILAKLLSLINTPAVQLLRVMNAPGTQLVRLVDAWRGELEKKAA